MAHSSGSFRSWMVWKYIFKWFQRQCFKIGVVAGKHPLKTLVCCALFVALCSLGFLKGAFVDEVDSLWVPSDSRAKRNSDTFDTLFPSDPFSRLERFIATPQSGPESDILQTDLLTELFTLFDGLFNLTVPEDPLNPNVRVGYQNFCATPVKNAGCIYFSPLGYWKENLTLMQTRTPAELHKDVNTLLLSGNIPVEQRSVLGCVDRKQSTDGFNQTGVTRVGALIFTLFIDTSKADIKVIERWESEFLDLLDTARLASIVAYGQTGVSTAQEISRQSRGDVILLAVSYVLMSAYMMLALGEGLPPRKSRCLLGIGAVLVVALAILSSLGFSALFFKFNPLTVQVLPFVMLSIGMDSVFILSYHFRRSVRALPAGSAPSNEELTLALSDSLYRQGANVALTGLTKAVSFLGPVAVLRIVALQEFCVVVAITVIFELLLTLFGFSALQILDARRVRAGLADIFPFVHVSPATSASVGSKETANENASLPALVPSAPHSTSLGESNGFERLPSAESSKGQAPHQYTIEASNGDPPRHHRSESTNGGVPRHHASPRDSEAHQARGVQSGLLDLFQVDEADAKSTFGKFLSQWYVPKVVGHPLWQVAILGGFGALLGFGIYGCVTLDESLDVRSLITTGTQLYNYLGLEEQCNVAIGPPMFLVTQNVDYSSKDVQGQIEGLINNLENSTWIDPPIYSWYEDFLKRYLPFSPYANRLGADGRPKTSEDFYFFLQEFLSNSIEGFAYSYDIIFERNATGFPVAVAASRMRTFYAPLATTADFVDAMLDTWQRVDQAPEISAFTESYFYVYYSQFVSIVQQYKLMMALTIVAIWGVTLVFVGFKTAAVVSALVLMIHIDMLGLAAFWDIQLNAVSAVNAVAIMGLADEFVNYVARAFEGGGREGASPKARMISALRQYLRPISNAALSTIIGVAPLAFAKSAAYRVYYFRMFLIATLISWGTGVILLPALLLVLHGDGLTGPVRRGLEARGWVRRSETEQLNGEGKAKDAEDKEIDAKESRKEGKEEADP